MITREYPEYSIDKDIDKVTEEQQIFFLLLLLV